MAYTKTVHKDRQVQYPSRYVDQESNQYTFTRDEGTVTEEGTLVNATVLNNMEDGIEAAHTVLGTTSATEIGYVKGVTSAIQTQLNEKLPLSGGTMAGNINLRGSSLRNGIAAYGAGNIDPNTTLSEIILTTHANCPTNAGGTDFYYIRTTFYSGDAFSANKSTSNNRVQEAIAFGLVGAQQNKLYIRTYISGAWTNWVEK